MGNKVASILLLLVILLFSNSSNADLLESSTRLANDSDNNEVFHQQFSFWRHHNTFIDHGIQYNYRSFKSGDSRSLSLLGDARLNHVGVNFNVGYDSHLSEPIGDGTLSYWYDYGSIELAYEKDLVDSEHGMSDQISFEHIYLTKEFNYHGRFILVGTLGQTNYSDNVRNDWWRVIGIYPINDNFNLIVQREEESFNDWSPYYFSPSEYSRTLLGFGTYHQLGNFELLTRVLYGTQSVYSDSNRSYYIRLNLSRYIELIDSSMGIQVILDQKEPEYRYDELIFTLQKGF